MFFLSSVFICCFISTISAQGASTGVVRLYRNGVADTNQSWSSGIVQVYFNSYWGNICDDFYFGSGEADVICHQLGYDGASSYSNTGTSTEWGSDSSPTLMDQVTCTYRSYLAITQCVFNNYVGSSCTSDSTDVIVTCYSTRIWYLAGTGDIRLTGGTYSNQGLLEVYCNGQWGTVCDDYFYSTQAQIACKQLGYNDYEDYNHASLTSGLFRKGTSSQPIFLRLLSDCTLSDDCLTQCGGCPSSGISSCSHDEDVTLECSYTLGNGDVYTTTSDTCYYYDYSTHTTNTNVVAVIIGSIVGFIVCIIVVIAVPICICMCLGVGIGAASRSGTRSRAVSYKSAPSAVITHDQYTSNTTTPLMAQPQPQPGYSSPYQPSPASIPQ